MESERNYTQIGLMEVGATAPLGTLQPAGSERSAVRGLSSSTLKAGLTTPYTEPSVSLEDSDPPRALPRVSAFFLVVVPSVFSCSSFCSPGDNVEPLHGNGYTHFQCFVPGAGRGDAHTEHMVTITTV